MSCCCLILNYTFIFRFLNSYIEKLNNVEKNAKNIIVTNQKFWKKCKTEKLLKKMHLQLLHD